MLQLRLVNYGFELIDLVLILALVYVKHQSQYHYSDRFVFVIDGANVSLVIHLNNLQPSP